MMDNSLLSFDLRTQKFDMHVPGMRSVDFVVFEIIGTEGTVAACKWERTANQIQVAAALERLAERLRKV